MKRFCRIYLLLWLFVAQTILAMADSCSGYNPSKHPDHYCDCKSYKNLIKLPMDVYVTDSVWFMVSSRMFMDGFTAYLYSDCDVSFDIYYKCEDFDPKYSVVIPKNQARDVTAESIKQKLENAGVGGLNMSIPLYVCICPIGGDGGRLMCYPYNTGYHSTCNDMLSLLPGMTFVSSHAEDVYEITADDIADSHIMYLQWENEDDAPCDLTIARGSCDGEAVVEYSFDAENGGVYYFDPALLKDVRAKGESLFVHFSHEASVVGRITFKEATFVEILSDTTICRGKEFVYEDMVVAESGKYFYDTVQLSMDRYEAYGYNVVFTEPDVAYDTIALKMSELPYSYRGEYTIPVDGFGDYDVVVHNEGDCDERILLHVERSYVTVELAQDSTLCESKRFYYDGRYWPDDVTFVDSVWSQTQDTMFVNILNVYFAPNDIVYDTLALTKREVRYYKHEGITIRDFGDYEKVFSDALECPDTLRLHVCHKVTDIEEVVDTTLCYGDVYVHNDVVYSESVVLVDSVWSDDDTRIITITNVNFVINEMRYDTLYLRYSDLPYLYAGQVEIREMVDTTISLLLGRCPEEVQLHVEHRGVDMLIEERDTTICRGKVYEHNDIVYSEATTVVDSVWLNRDTLQIVGINVYFAEPEIAYDTIVLRTTDLPYSYRGEQIVDFGVYDLMLQNQGECDEHVLLNVEHLITTVMAERDTTICRGKVYEHNDIVYSEATTIVDSVWLNRDTLQIVGINVYFAEPEVEYDTVYVTDVELNNGYYYELADAYIYSEGVHDYEIIVENECTRLISLLVEATITSAMDNVEVEEKPQLVMKNGIIYIYHNGEYYTLMGEKIGMIEFE